MTTKLPWWRRWLCKMGIHSRTPGDYHEINVRENQCECGKGGKIVLTRGYSTCKHCGIRFGWMVYQEF